MNDFYSFDETCQIRGLEFIYQGFFGRRKTGAFVEIGAYDGKNWSNTWCLAELGWRGIYVEPIQEYFDRCVANHKGHKNIHSVCALVSDKSGQVVPLYKIEGMYTLDKRTADMYGCGNTPWDTMTTMTLNELIYNNNYVLLREEIETRSKPLLDLLVIDVEGAEKQVLTGFDLAYYRPAMVIVETHEYNPDVRLREDAPWVNNLMATHGYAKVYSDDINAIWIDTDFTSRRFG